MKLFVTILEETFDRALDTIRALPADHDGVELRAERLGDIDLGALRRSTSKPIILTYRGSRVPSVERALEAGIDLVDIEWEDEVEIVAPERTILSHHDYDGMVAVEKIFAAMRARGCAQTKLAATPQTFEDNDRLLALVHGSQNSTVIGMGEAGLYSRILAPFLGSALTFVAAGRVAAPGQLTLERALAIYGEQRDALGAEKVFAVIGNPVAHSLSPSIHSSLFRQKKVHAAYTIAQVERFGEIVEAFLRGEPCGLSVTAPFKDDAYAFAVRHEAQLDENARLARAVNTLVNEGDRLVAANTDVDGFATLIGRLDHTPARVAVVGAGATARAALVALERQGLAATVFNRTTSRGDAPLQALASFGADLIINTLPGSVQMEIPPCDAYIEAAYGGSALRTVRTTQHIDGLALLSAQAVRQNELFMKVFDES